MASFFSDEEEESSDLDEVLRAAPAPPAAPVPPEAVELDASNDSRSYSMTILSDDSSDDQEESVKHETTDVSFFSEDDEDDNKKVASTREKRTDSVVRISPNVNVLTFPIPAYSRPAPGDDDSSSEDDQGQQRTDPAPSTPPPVQAQASAGPDTLAFKLECTGRENERLRRSLEDLSAEAEESEQFWAHEQQRREHNWELERLRLDHQLHEHLPMLHEDQLSAFQRGALQKVERAKQVLTWCRAEALRACDILVTENSQLEMRISEQDAALAEEKNEREPLLNGISRSEMLQRAELPELQQEFLAAEDHLRAELQALQLARAADEGVHNEVQRLCFEAQESAEVEHRLWNELHALRKERPDEGHGLQSEVERLRLELEAHATAEQHLVFELNHLRMEHASAEGLRAELQRFRREAEESARAEIRLWDEMRVLRSIDEGLQSKLDSVRAEAQASAAVEECLRLEVQTMRSLQMTNEGLQVELQSTRGTAQELEDVSQHLREEVMTNDALRLEIRRLQAEVENTSTRAGLQEAEVRMRAEAEVAESRRTVSTLRAELAVYEGRDARSAVLAPLRSPNLKDPVTMAVLRAMSGRKANAIIEDHAHVGHVGREKLVSLLQGSTTAVAALLQQVRGLNDITLHLSSKGTGRPISATAAQLRAVKVLERQTGRLERTNHEWARALADGSEDVLPTSLPSVDGHDSESDGEGLDDLIGFGAYSASRTEDSMSPIERGAALTIVLRRTEKRLESLHGRLLALTSPGLHAR